MYLIKQQLDFQELVKLMDFRQNGRREVPAGGLTGGVQFCILKKKCGEERDMKRKLATLCAALIAFVGAVWWFHPQPIVEEDFKIAVVQVGTELEDVTDQVDLEALEEVLRTGVRSRFPKKVSAFRLTGDTVHIASAGSWHIEFSVTRCMVYDSGERYGYTIENSGELWAEVLALMPGTD